MKAVGVLGASGYSGEVLVEILSAHPEVEKLVLASRTHAGQRVDKVLPRLTGLVGDLVFTEAEPDKVAAMGIPVWFLALPHGVSAEYAMKLVESGSIVIDLSADFRLHSPSLYEQYYGQPHPAADWLEKTPYVLPELSGEEWKRADLIACPGCYPTSILLPLIPLLKESLIDAEGIIINSMSGVSGAGKKDSLYYSYCERSESVVAYGLGRHRHLSEIEEQLAKAAGESIVVQFTPHLVPMMRGIATTIVATAKADLQSLYACWRKTYDERPGVRLLESGSTPETRVVLGRNRIDMSAFQDERTGKVVITSAIDNLMKGAGGQAVQIMNLRMGLPEFAGLS